MSTRPAASVTPTPASTAPTPIRVEGRGHTPVSVGEPIDIADLSGRIVFDDFEDVFTMRPDGTDVVSLTSREGSEFDGAWSPDGQFVVYRDSRRGINEDDEIYIVRADGTGARSVTNDPANDWGPDSSSDGELRPRRGCAPWLPRAPGRRRPDPLAHRRVGRVRDFPPTAPGSRS